MRTHAQLTTSEMRDEIRVPIHGALAGQHRVLGEVRLALGDVSTLGFLVHSRAGIERGDQVLVDLPVIGQVEALCIWTRYQEAGFSFALPVPTDVLEHMLGSCPR